MRGSAERFLAAERVEFAIETGRVAKIQLDQAAQVFNAVQVDAPAVEADMSVSLVGDLGFHPDHHLAVRNMYFETDWFSLGSVPAVRYCQQSPVQRDIHKTRLPMFVAMSDMYRGIELEACEPSLVFGRWHVFILGARLMLVVPVAGPVSAGNEGVAGRQLHAGLSATESLRIASIKENSSARRPDCTSISPRAVRNCGPGHTRPPAIVRACLVTGRAIVIFCAAENHRRVAQW